MKIKMKTICVLWVLFFVVSAKISPTQVLAEEIISIFVLGAENMRYVTSDNKWRKVGAFFKVPVAVTLPEYSPDKLVTLSKEQEGIIQLSYTFTDNELQEIIDFNRFKKGFDGNRITISSHLDMPAYSLDSEAGTAIAELLFTREDYYVVMQSPLTGNNINLSNIDYIKFPGVPLIPVPLPLK